jgi:hypothetical protein
MSLAKMSAQKAKENRVQNFKQGVGRTIFLTNVKSSPV